MVTPPDFFASYSGKLASTEDFQRIVEKHLGGEPAATLELGVKEGQ